MRQILLITLMALSTIPSYGALRETVSQCKLEYGEIFSDKPASAQWPYRTVEFKKDGFLIFVDFQADKAEMFAIFKADKTAWNSQDVKAWLDADLTKNAWVPKSKEPNVWTRPNGDQATLLNLPDAEFSLLTYSAQAYIRSRTANAKSWR
jgi:hypothetical protein